MVEMKFSKMLSSPSRCLRGQNFIRAYGFGKFELVPPYLDVSQLLLVRIRKVSAVSPLLESFRETSYYRESLERCKTPPLKKNYGEKPIIDRNIGSGEKAQAPIHEISQRERDLRKTSVHIYHLNKIS
ncbi:hypothetical protein METBIDRAFT_203268 [Metschnikowia bicuspidata var. bicuspidata NRRL YB-4993]|uniref:Uncharacterized protein n=1 Tax=Metschnikowia bicuspidata var. bicuspidata NRRL YB-4993 TaxID=869754 RepID=A0A1A0H9Z8_9ASCO|nr:hypothetical protein METBIDRAFT_203268 [Metschnikowia bicuspidata var. bicuspidata NRRL YB-4993]OBA20702.1 hypothetical protein METBIDRAFT_203268 [Metschnikowia bicuspidata var. bicuspidata NRRL YB-4993]